ncbi:hypothetical protein FDP41_004505 [Naegleria fowleri]|uniref:Uncharacterized protein n=1 Tax=Naegleria fowleri TaxID=5763 RepID=A0A6A5BNQ6_NAEFO|nr:uncharacterized protein FDP41_004505 [Naegleria fowleri]KAF0976606.1 hypothetical protein FDP41_004505 [Naegleria fowleri]
MTEQQQQQQPSKPTFLGKKFNPVKSSSKYHQERIGPLWKRFYNTAIETWKTPLGKRICIFGGMSIASVYFVLAPTIQKVVRNSEKEEEENSE